MHRLGGVGLAAFERQQQSQRSFNELSNEISQAQVQHLHSQLDQFRHALLGFASTHRESIRKDPAFRLAFQRMCSTIGVDHSVTGNFSSCSDKVGMDFVRSQDSFFPTQFYISALLERGVRVLIYVGANDWICNWVSAQTEMCTQGKP